MYRLYLAFLINSVISPIDAATVHVSSAVSPLSSALIIGTAINAQTLFLCRAYLSGRVHFGTTWAGSQLCVFTENGKEYSSAEYTVPKEKEFGHYYWAAKGGKAIRMGTDSRGTDLFLCQTQFKGTLLPGKTWPGYPHCNIDFQGVEVIADIASIFSSM
jgi:hypothetical protein